MKLQRVVIGLERPRRNANAMAISSQNKWDEEIKWNDTRWGEVNNKVNEEDLKCQQIAEHEYDSLFSDTVEVSQ